MAVKYNKLELTLNQFKGLEDEGIMHVDDFPLDWDNEVMRLYLFNELPRPIQGLAVMWGFSDTEVRDDLFVHLCDRFFEKTTEEYYEDFKGNFTEENRQKFTDEIIISNKLRLGILKECPNCGTHMPFNEQRKWNPYGNDPDYKCPNNDCDSWWYNNSSSETGLSKWEMPF